MRLYLIQHGVSLPEDVDPQKGLSDSGRIQTQKMARFLKKNKVEVELIWHSKKLRSIQTAQILTPQIEYIKIEEREDINPLDSVDKFPEVLTNLNKDLMIVGHLPFLQRLASRLLLGSADYSLFSFKNSGVVCLEYKEAWRILWMVNPDLV